MDVAHAFGSTRFAEHVWEEGRSSGDTRTLAYALGLMSHVATDATVHPYVNTISGGPYRNQSKRHVLIENFSDTYLVHSLLGMDLSHSHLHKRIDLGGDLPSHLRTTVVSALRAVYGRFNLSSGVPSPDDVNLMYKMFSKWLSGTTGEGIFNPPPPLTPDQILKDLKDILSKLKPRHEFDRQVPLVPGFLMSISLPCFNGSWISSSGLLRRSCCSISS